MNGVNSGVDADVTQFKLIDAGILQYLKLVHTELYEKLKAAVRSIKNKNH